MEFNENQLFYASLWWVNALPGGPDAMPDICEKYGKPLITFPDFTPTRKPRRWRDLSSEEQQSFEEKFGDEIDASLTEDHADLSEFSRNFLTGLSKTAALSEKFAEFAVEDIEEPIEKETLETFFESLLRLLKERTALNPGEVTNPRALRTCYVGDHVANQIYMEMGDEPYALLNGLTDKLTEQQQGAVHIIAKKIPTNSSLYIHNDGQIFVPQQNGDKTKLVSIDYPGKPDLPYEHVELKPEDFDNSPTLTWETLYRVVSLEPGQSLKYGWMTVAGDRHETEEIVSNREVLVVGNNDVDDASLLETLTDEEIINFDPRLRGSIPRFATDVTPGHTSASGLSHIEATDKSNIVKSLMPGIAYMVVENEPVQLGIASNFSIAQPGDYIIRESERSLPRVIKKELIESDRVRFVFDSGNAPTPGLN